MSIKKKRKNKKNRGDSKLSFVHTPNLKRGAVGVGSAGENVLSKTPEYVVDGLLSQNSIGQRDSNLADTSRDNTFVTLGDREEEQFVHKTDEKSLVIISQEVQRQVDEKGLDVNVQEITENLRVKLEESSVSLDSIQEEDIRKFVKAELNVKQNQEVFKDHMEWIPILFSQGGGLLQELIPFVLSECPGMIPHGDYSRIGKKISIQDKTYLQASLKLNLTDIKSQMDSDHAEVEGDKITSVGQMFLTVLVDPNSKEVKSAKVVVNDKREMDCTAQVISLLDKQALASVDEATEIDVDRTLSGLDSQEVELTPEFVTQSDKGELSKFVELCQMVQYCGGKEEVSALMEADSRYGALSSIGKKIAAEVFEVKQIENPSQDLKTSMAQVFRAVSALEKIVRTQSKGKGLDDIKVWTEELYKWQLIARDSFEKCHGKLCLESVTLKEEYNSETQRLRADLDAFFKKNSDKKRSDKNNELGKKLRDILELPIQKSGRAPSPTECLNQIDRLRGAGKMTKTIFEEVRKVLEIQKKQIDKPGSRFGQRRRSVREVDKAIERYNKDPSEKNKSELMKKIFEWERDNPNDYKARGGLDWIEENGLHVLQIEDMGPAGKTEKELQQDELKLKERKANLLEGLTFSLDDDSQTERDVDTETLIKEVESAESQKALDTIEEKIELKARKEKIKKRMKKILDNPLRDEIDSAGSVEVLEGIQKREEDRLMEAIFEGQTTELEKGLFQETIKKTGSSKRPSNPVMSKAKVSLNSVQTHKEANAPKEDGPISSGAERVKSLYKQKSLQKAEKRWFSSRSDILKKVDLAVEKYNKDPSKDNSDSLLKAIESWRAADPEDYRERYGGILRESLMTSGSQSDRVEMEEFFDIDRWEQVGKQVEELKKFQVLIDEKKEKALELKSEELTSYKEFNEDVRVLLNMEDKSFDNQADKYIIADSLENCMEKIESLCRELMRSDLKPERKGEIEDMLSSIRLFLTTMQDKKVQ